MSKLTLLAAAVWLLFPLTARSAQEEMVFKCDGNVSSVSPSWTQSHQSIAMHIENGRITFSGNDYLRGEDIQICRGSDELYFDSDTCSGTVTTETRQYGTFNKILMRLDLTNTNANTGSYVILSGRFTCTSVQKL